MLSAVRSSTLKAANALPYAFQATRSMSLQGVKGFNEHEQAVENMYFSKEDERLMSKLLAKVKKQTQVTDISAATQSAVAEEAALRNIVAKYKLSKEDFQALLDWKHATY
eukprot:gene11255-11404_t